MSNLLIVLFLLHAFCMLDQLQKGKNQYACKLCERETYLESLRFRFLTFCFLHIGKGVKPLSPLKLLLFQNFLKIKKRSPVQ